MSERECACARFDRLEGAATQAYISQFLEKTDADEEAGKTWYLCKVCRRPWVRVMVEGNRNPSLVRLDTEFNV